MAEQVTKPTNEELINQMYDASLAGQKTQLEQTRDQGLADLQKEQERLQQQTDANLNRTYVEAARDQRNYAEVQNAYGLSSGAMAQARLAQDNQLEADLTALRNAQTTIDANIERERTTLSQQYAAAIAQAQADNDLQRAQALYQAAKDAEAQLRQNQVDAGKLMASAGDYSILANIYGLTPEQVALLTGEGGGTGGTGGAGGDGYGGGGETDNYGETFTLLRNAWNNTPITLAEVNAAIDSSTLTWQQKLTLKQMFAAADASGRR